MRFLFFSALFNFLLLNAQGFQTPLRHRCAFLRPVITVNTPIHKIRVPPQVHLFSPESLTSIVVSAAELRNNVGNNVELTSETSNVVGKVSAGVVASRVL